MSPKAMVFDFNGVFVKPKELAIVGSVCSATRFGRWIALSNYYLNILGFEEGRASPKEFWAAVFPSLTDNEYKELIEAAYEKPFAANPEMYSLANALGKTMPVYCLSNSNFLQGKACRRQKLYAPFRHVFLSHEMHCAKPFPQAYRAALQGIGLEAHECVFVDDSLQNVLAAKLLGFKTLKFTGVAGLEAGLRRLGVPLPGL